MSVVWSAVEPNGEDALKEMVRHFATLQNLDTEIIAATTTVYLGLYLL